MNIQITFRNMDHSDAIEEYARQQLKKVVTFLENDKEPIFIDLILEPSKLREHSRVELRIKTPTYDLVNNYEHQGESFHDVLDRVIDVMYRRLCEEKRKNLDMKKMRGRHDDFKKER